MMSSWPEQGCRKAWFGSFASGFADGPSWSDGRPTSKPPSKHLGPVPCTWPDVVEGLIYGTNIFFESVDGPEGVRDCSNALCGTARKRTR